MIRPLLRRMRNYLPPQQVTCQLRNSLFGMLCLVGVQFASAENPSGYSILPAAGDVKEMPSQFTIIIDGCTSLTKNIFQNAVKVTAPGASADEFLWSSYTIDGNKIVCTPNKQLDLTLKGEYIVELVAGSLYLDGNSSNPCQSASFVYKTGESAGPSTGGDYGDLISSDYQLTVSPQPGDCAKLSLITISFPDWADADIKTAALNSGLVTLAKDGTVVKTFTKADVDNAYNDQEEVIAFTVDPAITSDDAGLYTLTILAGALNLIEMETFKSTTNEHPITIKWNIVGEVAYTVQPISIKPAAGVLDLRETQFECFLINVPQGILPVEGTKINFKTADGSYDKDFDLVFNFGTQLVAWVPSAAAPKYNGEYTLTIPQGSFGDSNFRANPEIGIANPLLTYTYNIVGGRPNNNVEYDLNPTDVTPAAGNVGELKEIVFTFPEDVLFTPDATLTLAASWGSRYLCTAPIERVDSKTVKVTLSPSPYEAADYAMYIPEGTFFDSTYQADNNEGHANEYLSYVWTMGSLISVTSTNPEDESQLAGMETGYTLAIVTDDSLLAKACTLKLTDTDNATTDERILLNNVPMTRSNRTWTWTNTGKEIVFYEGHTYTFEYTMYDATPNIIGSGMIIVDGSTTSSVGQISSYTLSAPICNAQGIYIGTDLSALPKGLYIQAGKKIIKK